MVWQGLERSITWVFSGLSNRGKKWRLLLKYCLSLRLSKIKKIVYRFSLSVIGYYQVPVQWIQAAVEVFKDTGLKMTSRHSPEVLNLWVLLGGQ